MDTSILCVYNLERRVFLSSKVTIINGLSEPLKVVRLLVSGLGVGEDSSLWLTNLHGTLTLPKLFPYDLACLDKDLRVVETIEVLPGVEFPPYRWQVSSAVLLPPDTLRTTKTRVGDRVIICPTEQSDKLLANLDSAHAPLAPEESLVEIQDAAQPGGSLASAHGSSVSITEAVVEKPEALDAPVAQGGGGWSGVEDLFANWVDSPSAPPSWISQKAREHEGEARKIKNSSDEERLIAKNPDSQSTEPAGVTSKATQIAKTPASVDQKKESNAPPSKPPIPALLPQPLQKATFTIERYGSWQLSSPAAVGHIVSGRRTGSNGAASQSQGKRDAGVTPSDAPRQHNGNNGTFAKPSKIATNWAASESADAEKGPSLSRFEKPSDRLELKKAEPSPAAPLSPKAVPETKTKLPPTSSAEALKPKAVAASESAVQPEYAHSSVVDPALNPNYGKSANASQLTNFEATIQNKLDRALMKVPADGPEASLPKSEQVLAKETSAETRESGFKPKPANFGGTEKAVNTAATKVSSPRPVSPQKRFHNSKTVQSEKPKNSSELVASERKNGAQPDSLGARFKRWLNPAPSKPSDRRRAHRRYVPGVSAFYFTGGAPKPHDVADISMSGMYLQTDDRWSPDTMIRMTLQKPCARGERKQSITVLSRIVRRGSDGVAAEFVMEEALDRNSREVLPSHGTDRFSLARFL